ncbi:MAG: hypothetical protein CMF41_01650 [Legionellales bacterium]|nr:hypothetical protein [Legionellales bacterium]OUX66029.1 MAG: hypothetical protein CBE41_00855 [Gammaproteobacteria bacterium TMED281]
MIEEEEARKGITTEAGKDMADKRFQLDEDAADLDGDGRLSSYERQRGEAIQKAMMDDEFPEMYHGGLMCGAEEPMEMDEPETPEPPPGALPEEVADDIPAFLSTGEFVLSADVVRWHGLKHIMEMRDEAKEGLMAMEYEGQIQEVETEEYDGEGAMDSEVSYEDGASEEGVEELLAEIPAPPAEGDILETAVLSVAEMGSEDIEDDYYPSKEGQFSFMPKVSFALIK